MLVFHSLMKLCIFFSDSILQEIQKKITDAFDVFDHDNSKVVDEREVGTIMRSLGCVFTEAELDDILQEIVSLVLEL